NPTDVPFAIATKAKSNQCWRPFDVA
ncbi:uncharacterized protein METZ01_LOCUS103520, partial [marine metagenome]